MASNFAGWPGMHRDHNAVPSQTDGTDIVALARDVYITSRAKNKETRRENRRNTSRDTLDQRNHMYGDYTSGSAMAEGPCDALVSRNSATTKHPI